MARENQNNRFNIERDLEGFVHNNNELDDDGQEKRKGTLLTASAHIVTAVIGSGVLSLGWATSQLGWIGGPTVLVAFSILTYITSVYLADCYRAPVTDRRNYKYMDAVKCYLGGRKVKLCGVVQYANLIGASIGYTITASISMVAVERSNCFHKYGHQATCRVSNYPSMAIFGAIQIFLSQLPNFHKIAWLSIIAAVMSFSYSSIGLALSVAQVAEKGPANTTLTGTIVGVDVTRLDKIWKVFQAIGNVAFAYTFSSVLIEIQDTLKSSTPETEVMKKASLIGVTITSIFYILCGCMGYLAFGNNSPGNFLTGFGFYEPFWLIDFANVCIVVHLFGAYQVFAQPVFELVERNCIKRCPKNNFLSKEIAINVPCYGVYGLNFFRLIWRTVYVIVLTVIAMILPFFTDFLGLIGAISFVPLTVYFPIEMHIAQKNIPRYSFKWIALKVLSMICVMVAFICAIGSIQGLIQSVKKYKPFAF